MSPLIPRKLLFGKPHRTMVQLCPRGCHLTFLAPVDGVSNVWMQEVASPESARPLTHDRDRGVQSYCWSFDHKHILALSDYQGDENPGLMRVRTDSGVSQRLAGAPGIAVDIVQTSPLVPDKILISMNDRDPRHRDLYLLDLESGQRALVVESEGFDSFLADEHLNVRFARRNFPDAGAQILQLRWSGDWTPLINIPAEDALTTSYVGCCTAENTLYLQDSRGSDRAALTAVDAATGECRIVARDERADLDKVLWHPTHFTPRAAAFYWTKRRWEVFDDDIDPDALTAGDTCEIDVVSQTADGRTLLLYHASSDRPPRYAVYDCATKKVSELFSIQPPLETYAFRPRKPEIIRTKDDLNLVSYVTLPHAREATHRLPLVLCVHGGPYYRDFFGWSAWHQWLANRGYAALSTNFRGSTGFGKGFLNASDREWGGKIQEDLLRAVDWAIGEGIADPARIGIMGGSFGGYSAMLALARYPDRFACGVSFCGISDLFTFLQNQPPYWDGSWRIMMRARLADHTTAEGQEFLRSQSPLHMAERITSPLFIAQGANDVRVTREQSDCMADTLKRHGVPVTYLLYPDEGHGFYKEANNLSVHALAEQFLARHLGGRCEEVGEDLQRSSMQVVAGNV